MRGPNGPAVGTVWGKRLKIANGKCTYSRQTPHAYGCKYRAKVHMSVFAILSPVQRFRPLPGTAIPLSPVFALYGVFTFCSRTIKNARLIEKYDFTVSGHLK